LISYSDELNLGPGDDPYYSNRERFNQLKKKDISKCTRSEKAERAVLMIYLNKTGYSGMYRENKNTGNFNVPCGHYKNPTIIDTKNLYAVSDSFKSVSLKHNDFKKTLKYPREGDFVYLDPPYMPCGKVSHFRDYHRSGFDNTEQEKLCSCFSKLNDRGCKIMLSNSSCQELNDMYESINNVDIHTVSALRLINQKNIGRTFVDEFVILNYKP
jgi:DNA adenine methylase